MTKLRVVKPEELTQKEIRTLFSLTIRGCSELRYRFHKVVAYLKERHIPGRIKEINSTIDICKKKHHKKPTVEAWDTRSEKFYKKFGNKLEITYYSFY